AAGPDWLHIPAIFINLFAGDSAPLSRVAVELGLLQLQPPHVSAAIDALDDTVFPTLEQICAAGVVGVLWCAPPPSADLQSRSRACRLIHLVVSRGGVAIFEQASASLAWLDPVVAQMVHAVTPYLVISHQCQWVFGQQEHVCCKRWTFASNRPLPIPIAGECACRCPSGGEEGPASQTDTRTKYPARLCEEVM
ncbi:unnamed protein product, partial [Effrenium voratum]